MWKFIQNEENENADDERSSDERASCFQQKKYPAEQSKRRKQVVFVIGFGFTLIVLFVLYLIYHDNDPLGSAVPVPVYFFFTFLNSLNE